LGGAKPAEVLLEACGSEGRAHWLSAAVSHRLGALSPKEAAVVLAAAQGTEDKEIADRLGCSLSTVRTLWQRVYRKTGSVSRRKIIADLWNDAMRLAAESFQDARDKSGTSEE